MPCMRAKAKPQEKEADICEPTSPELQPSRIPAPKIRVSAEQRQGGATRKLREVATAVAATSRFDPVQVKSLAAARAAYKTNVGAVSRSHDFTCTLLHKLENLMEVACPTFSLSCASMHCSIVSPRGSP